MQRQDGAEMQENYLSKKQTAKDLKLTTQPASMLIHPLVPLFCSYGFQMLFFPYKRKKKEGFTKVVVFHLINLT